MQTTAVRQLQLHSNSRTVLALTGYRLDSPDILYLFNLWISAFLHLEVVMFFRRRVEFKFKEGIDNPVMVVTEDAGGVVSGPEPRVCVLKKEEGQSFGFHLQVEKGNPGHVIRQVESRGVAERAGLRDGDRLLEVNDLFVDDLEHPEIARWVQLSGLQVCVLVLGGEEYEQARAQGWNLREVCRSQRGEKWKRPQLCHIRRDNVTGLGLTITPVEGEKGKFAVNPVSGGSAEKAGVQKGDRLVWINGAMACELTQSAIQKMVKKCGDHMTVLVTNSESEKSYVSRKMPILPAMADANNMPHRPRRLHMEQGPDGYGLVLKQEKNSAGRKVHVLCDLDAGGPAELAGVKHGDLLLEVNGKSTECLGHEDVVIKFKESKSQVTITTIAAAGQDYYTRLGLSPLLFCEDLKQQQEDPAPEPSAAAVNVTAPPVGVEQQLQDEPSPRRCEVKRGSLGFGFHLGSVQHKPGIFISQLSAWGTSQDTGLLQDDVVLEVNGQDVQEESLEDVILLMKRGGASLSLLVIDRAGYERMKKNRKTDALAEEAKPAAMSEPVSVSPVQSSPDPKQ